MTKTISFVGHERCGKDTIAEAVTQNLISRGFRVGHFANADALKTMACLMLGITLDELERTKASGAGFWYNESWYTARDFLINLSENWVKPVFGQTVWADVFSKFIADNQDLDFIIKTDDRYDADLFPNTNTKYVAVVRDGVEGIKTTPYFDTVNDLIGNADVTIVNNIDFDSIDFKKYINTMTQLIERQFE